MMSTENQPRWLFLIFFEAYKVEGRHGMRVLFIGGTGIISQAITRQVAKQNDELYVLNRGNHNENLPINVKVITADINEEEKVRELIKDLEFDVVVDFIAFVPEHLERDYRLFHKKTKQFIFISSASAYQKPLSDYRINEATPLANPYWEYSRNKIRCEEYLMKLYREEGFPITIVRPSHTYDERSIPVGVHGRMGSYQVIDRMRKGKPVIIHGDGTSLWTMTHQSDFAKGFLGLMGNIHAIGESVQITSDETLTWNQIYQCIANALSVEFKPYYVASSFLGAVSDYDLKGSLLGDKANSVVFDNTKLKRLVPEFVATKRFDQGVYEAVQYVLSHKECQIEDQEFEEWCDSVIDTLENAKQLVFKRAYKKS